MKCIENYHFKIYLLWAVIEATFRYNGINGTDPLTEHTALTGHDFIKMLSTNVGQKLVTTPPAAKSRSKVLRIAAICYLFAKEGVFSSFSIFARLVSQLTADIASLLTIYCIRQRLSALRHDGACRRFCASPK